MGFLVYGIIIWVILSGYTYVFIGWNRGDVIRDFQIFGVSLILVGFIALKLVEIYRWW